MQLDKALLTADWLKRFSRHYLTLDCGAWSYGQPNVRLSPNDRPRKLSIGRYCSIAENVTIFVGGQGRHPTDTLTTYPLRMAVSAEMLESRDKRLDFPDFFEGSSVGDKCLDVMIGDDVWIGAQSMILAGASIGTGAVIGARSLVTGTIPPYAIAAGTPARVIRYRHSPEVIAELLRSGWWLLDPDEIWARCGSLVSSVRVSEVLSLLDSG